jgi:hypothetical protein
LSHPVIKENLSDLTQVQLEIDASISWDVMTDEETANVTVHTYLQGTHEAVEKVRQVSKEFDQGPWENSEHPY